MSGETNTLKIISYNLKFHKANIELAGLIERYGADILCLQECYPEQLPASIGGLKLAKKTYFRLGLAIYYRPERFEAVKSQSHLLKHSVYDKIISPTRERLLVSELFDKTTGKNIFVGSFHAAHLVATNHVRRIQIESAHMLLNELCQGSPAIMVGDYNYPLFKKSLKLCVEKTGYQLARSDLPTYYITKLIRAHFDLATSLNTHIDRVRTLPKGLSDHAPILIQANI